MLGHAAAVQVRVGVVGHHEENLIECLRCTIQVVGVKLRASELDADWSQPAPAVDPSRQCTARLFHIIKKPLSEKKFGPSEFDAESAPLNDPEPVDCSLARSRVPNVLLLKLVKDGFPKAGAVVGAEWAPGSTWQGEPDAPQRRADRSAMGR